MTIQDVMNYYFPEDEKPLDRIPDDGGFCAIFRKIACVGDSLSSGEFETKIPGEPTHYNDFYEYSWGQYIARMCGSEVLNFSKGGMTAREYMLSFGDKRDLWNPLKKAQAYIIALGCNDLNGYRMPLGSVEDVCLEDPSRNADTFAGWYGRVVQRYREISPDAKFFFVTMPAMSDPDALAKNAGQAELMRGFAKLFPNSYVIDLMKYGPVYDAAFKEKFYMHGHLNPCGYIFTAKIIAAYIDWIVRHNMQDFKRVGYINTPLSDSEIAKKTAAYEQKKAEEAAKGAADA